MNDAEELLKQFSPTRPSVPPLGNNLATPASGDCPRCRGVDFWVDGYGRRHCDRCEPIPHPSLAVKRLTLVDGVFQEKRPPAATEHNHHDRRRAKAIALLDVACFFHDGHEWVAWSTDDWHYATRTFGRPIKEIGLWIQRTRALTFEPDEMDFRRGSRLPEVSGLTVVWYSVIADKTLEVKT